MTFPTKKLGEVSRVFAGSSAPQDDRFFSNGKYPFVRVSDLKGLQNKNLTDIRDKINDLALSELKPVFARKGTIVFPKSGAAIATNARAILGIDAYIVSHLAAIKARKELALSEWLFLILVMINMRDLSANSAYPSLQLSQIKKIEIPLPTLHEQKKIVKKIEELFGKIDEAQKLREEAQKDATALIPAALHQIFERGKKEGWPFKKLGGIIELLYGKGISRSERNSNGKYPIYGANGVLGRTNKFLIEGEAIIVGRKGSAGEITRVSGRFWPSDVTYYVLGNDKADINFLFYLLKKLNLQKLAVGVKPGINRNRVYEIKIPFPPLPKQKKIVAYLDSLSEKSRAMQELQKQTAEDLKALKQSILQKAFKGELV